MPTLAIHSLEEIDLQALIDYFTPFPTVAFCSWSNKSLLESLIETKQLFGYAVLHEGKIVGAILGGTLGLRGTINHLAVDPSFRRQKIGKTLVDLMFARFLERGIQRTFVFTMKEAIDAVCFWRNLGFESHSDEVTLEKDI